MSPPLLCAPMAGITHSAFRRLVAGFGGYGALCTEMLSVRAVCSENSSVSPFTKKRACEGPVVYQLRATDPDDIPRAIAQLENLQPFAIDINLGCPAPEVKRYGGGIELFDDRERLARVLEKSRASWNGPLTVKCRIGKRKHTWQEIFRDRLALFETCGIDAITVHPRFSRDKLKRSVCWEIFPWIAAHTILPIIANGNIIQPDEPTLSLLRPGSCAGLMIGRMAVVKPWIFREFCGQSVAVDYLDVWTRLFDYTCEDFPPEKAIGRIKEFTAYYAQNFLFSHDLYKAVQGAHDLKTIKSRATAFLSSDPELSKEPSVMGI